MTELLKQLSALDGVSGYEAEVRDAIRKQIAPHCDALRTDPVGNLIAFKKGAQRRKKPLVVCSHMDEAGFLVKSVTADGLIKMAPVGKIEPQVIVGRQMRVGPKKLPGVISLKAIHLTKPEERKEPPALTGLYVDIGSTSKAQTEALTGVGDPIAFGSGCAELGEGHLKGKALNGRAGCAVMVKMLAQPHPFDTWYVFSAGREIANGVKAAISSIAPGTCLLLDGVHAADLPGVPEEGRASRLGHGPAVVMVDGALTCAAALRQAVTAAADKAGIPWQLCGCEEPASDAGIIRGAGSGVEVFRLGCPTRYIRTAASVINLADLAALYELSMLFCREVNYEN